MFRLNACIDPVNSKIAIYWTVRRTTSALIYWYPYLFSVLTSKNSF